MKDLWIHFGENSFIKNLYPLHDNLKLITTLIILQEILGSTYRKSLWKTMAARMMVAEIDIAFQH